tara:strand:- start:133 stop:2016 length:1884 start_codon:yes stop_codon:yes gene_type:complete
MKNVLLLEQVTKLPYLLKKYQYDTFFLDNLSNSVNFLSLFKFMITSNPRGVTTKEAKLAMKKFIGIVAVVIACSGGGYLFVANKAQTAAEEAITEIEREIEKLIPDSDFTFGAVSTDIFSKTAQVSDLALKLNDETLISAHLHVILGEDERTLSAELTGVEGSSKDNGADFNFSMKSILLTDANIASAKTFMDEMDSNPIAAIKAFNDVSIGGLNATDLSFTIDVDSEEVFNLSGGVELSGIKNGEIQAFNMAGSTSDKYGQIFGAPTDGSLKNINITGLDFGNLLAAVAMEDEQLLLAELQTGFGVTAVSIDGLVANIADLKAKLTSGKIEIADNVIENFSLTDFGFTDTDEEIALDIGKAQFKGLNLGFDFLSEKAVIENATQFYGLTEIGIYDVSYTIEGNEFGIDDLSLTDVALDSGFLVKSTLNANGIRIPIELIAEMDRSVARSIENFTDSESFTLSFSNSNDFNTEDGTYDVNLSLGVEGFAVIKINAAYAGLDFQRLRRVYKSEDFIEMMDGLSKIGEELSMSSVYFEYTDDQLADVILSQVPDVKQLVMMSDMQIDMFLSQYPDQADQLKASIKAFLEGTNTFKASMDAEAVVKIMDIPDLFVSGNLTNSISVAFEGN